MTKLKLFILFSFWFSIAYAQSKANLTDQDTIVYCSGDPRFSAEFPGGSQNLLSYLQKNVINNLNLTQDEVINIRRPLAKFLITEKGNVDSVLIMQSSNIQRVDSIFKASIIAMPKWKPAMFYGKKTSQYFYLPLRIETK
jgi:hypothetical protein